MRINSCPEYVVKKLLTLTDRAACLEEDAKAAAAKLERARIIVNQGTRVEAERERWEKAKLEFEALLPSVPKLKKRAAAETATVSVCKRFIEALDDHATISAVRAETDGHSLDQVRGKLVSIDEELKALRNAVTPSADIGGRVDELVSWTGRALERKLDIQGLSGGDLRLLFHADCFDENVPFAWRLKCATEPKAAASWLLGEIERRASVPMPPAQRPGRITVLMQQRHEWFYIEARLFDAADAAGEFVERLADSPPEAVLGIAVKVSEKLNGRSRLVA